MQELALLIGSPNGSLPVIESCLSELQLAIEEVGSGAAALQVLSPDEHGLVVCDLPLADMSAARLVSRVRCASRATSVILVGGPPRGPDLSEIVKAGADECVGRPIHRARLIEAIARSLATRRLAMRAGPPGDERRNAPLEGDGGLVSEAIRALTRCLEAKDSLSNGHGRSVAHMAAVIATHLGLADEEVQEARLASAVHDLGKVAVSQKILCKPGALSEREWQEIRQHPQLGADILRSIEPLSGIATYVRHHHERYDGKGYPDGLQGGEIPLTSRIIAVADAYDAMLMARPYRKPSGLAYAAGELERHAGAQWDADVVDSLFACVPQLAVAT